MCDVCRKDTDLSGGIGTLYFAFTTGADGVVEKHPHLCRHCSEILRDYIQSGIQKAEKTNSL
jgi:hypothetical protein